jgi:tRNA threonylcarbamoyl adenosine modification protein YeaZ
MLVLALDTATPAVTAAAVRVDEGAVDVLAARVTVDARRHGELLTPSVRDVLDRSGHRAEDLDAVVAGVGPGPFTGLRVGLVTAAGLADALDRPTYAVCSLDAVAAAALADGAGDGGGRLLVATDARRREVYWAVYDAAGARTAGPEVARPADLAALLPGLGARVMAGAGAEQYRDVLGLPMRGVLHPDPAALAGLAAERVLAKAPSERLTPLYLRRPDATPPGVPKRVSPP